MWVYFIITEHLHIHKNYIFTYSQMPIYYYTDEIKIYYYHKYYIKIKSIKNCNEARRYDTL